MYSGGWKFGDPLDLLDFCINIIQNSQKPSLQLCQYAHHIIQCSPKGGFMNFNTGQCEKVLVDQNLLQILLWPCGLL